MSERKKVTLIITAFEEHVTFPRKNGQGDTTIYRLTATNERGEPFDPERFPLRSFWVPGDAEIGQPREYEVERFDHPKYGLSYTVHRGAKPDGGGGGLKASVDALRAEVKQLREELETLREEIAVHFTPRTADKDIPF